jgi:hypothetical protein
MLLFYLAGELKILDVGGVMLEVGGIVVIVWLMCIQCSHSGGAP